MGNVDSQIEIQRAIFKALNDDSKLNKLITGVFDFVQENQGFPYVSIGADNFSDFGSHTFDGVDGIVMIDTWTQGNSGRLRVKEIQAEIYRILHDETLTVTGFCVINMRREFVETVLDPDGQTHHGIERYGIILTD